MSNIENYSTGRTLLRGLLYAEFAPVRPGAQPALQLCRRAAADPLNISSDPWPAPRRRRASSRCRTSTAASRSSTKSEAAQALAGLPVRRSHEPRRRRADRISSEAAPLDAQAVWTLPTWLESTACRQHQTRHQTMIPSPEHRPRSASGWCAAGPRQDSGRPRHDVTSAARGARLPLRSDHPRDHSTTPRPRADSPYVPRGTARGASAQLPASAGADRRGGQRCRRSRRSERLLSMDALLLGLRPEQTTACAGPNENFELTTSADGMRAHATLLAEPPAFD